MVEAFLAGTVVACLNGLAALGIIRWSLHKESKTFLKLFVGGMILRIAAVGLAVFLILWNSSLHRFAFAGGLVVTIIAFQVIEIASLLKGLRRRSVPESGPGK